MSSSAGKVRDLDNQYVCEKCGPVLYMHLKPGEGARILHYGVCDVCFGKRSEKFWNWALLTALLVLILLFALSGCGVKPDKRYEYNDIENMVPGPEIHTLTYGYRVEVFYLNDGTRCVTLDGKGLACQWKENENVVLRRGESIDIPRIPQ